MAAGQDWCLYCGAGAPGSLTRSGWRSTAMVVGGVTALALAAAAAGYAALSKGPARPRVLTTTVAQAPPPGTSAPSTPTTAAPSTPSAQGPGAKGKGGLGLGGAKPPKIPLTAITPKASGTGGASGTATSPASTPTTSAPTTSTPPPSPAGGSGAAGKGKADEESQQAAILLDTDAASTYNPYEYPASGFGDPSLAIDGDTATAWSAQLNPATAPRMAQGLLIDLKAKQKVAVLELVTSTPGMTIQVYGANGHTAPSSITAPAWKPLSRPRTVKKRHLRIALRDSSKAFTFIALWISKAPKSSIGTAEAPGHVSVNELELFPPRS
jgi:hypothetical protein